ncbi:MAG: hypothetical protein ACRDAJ_06960 [Serratia fonticola]
MYSIRVKTKRGESFVANLPDAFDNEHTRLESYENGIRVATVGEAPVFINAATRQISRDPEVCRSALIVDPRFLTIGREANPALRAIADNVIYKEGDRNA